MSINASSVMEHFGERIKRIALYDPLYRLERKNKKDHNEMEIPYYELGMLTLLFFFENMIMRQKTCGTKELAYFLYEETGHRIQLNLEEFEELAREVIDVFRPTTGKRNSKTFYNWETRKEETIYYSILKAGRSDLKSNTQYYILDEAGLELIFSSREYFSEFQISISQLLLRKQLEKGEFVGALRQVDEMNLAVGALRDRLLKIKNDVSRSIVSEETYNRYKGLIEDINTRLERENEEFDELRDFVRQTKDSLKYQIENEKDKKAYELILKIDNNLEKVHHEHRKLLQESIVLRSHALEAAQQALYFIGIDSFNFEQDITNYLLGKPLPLASSKPLIDPFFKIKQTKQWYPLSIFQKQRIEKSEEGEKGKAYQEAAMEEVLNQDKKVIQAYFKQIIEEVLVILDGRSKITLEEVCTKLEEKQEVFLSRRLFYDFWIILHQKSPIDLKEIEEDSLLYGVKEALSQSTNTIKVIEREEEVQKVSRFKIKNMFIDLTIEVEGEDVSGV